MNNKSNIVVILTLLFLFPTVVQGISFAETYYVDAINGNDTNSGTSAAPWKTLTKVKNTVKSGDTAIFKSGDYGSLNWAIAADNTDWITLRAAPGHTPIISGTDAVSGLSAAAQIRPYPWNVIRNAYICFDGFKFTNIFYSPGRINYLKFLSCDMQQAPAVDASGVEISGYYYPYYEKSLNVIHCNGIVNNLTIQNCDIHSGWRPMMIYGSDILVKGNLLHCYASDGIAIAGGSSDPDHNNITIEDNHIYDMRAYMGTIGIYGTKEGDFIVHEPISLVGTEITGVVTNTVWEGEGCLNTFGISQQTIMDLYQASGSKIDPSYYILGQYSGAKVTDIYRVIVGGLDGIDMEVQCGINNMTIRRNIIDLRQQFRYDNGTGQVWKLGCDTPSRPNRNLIIENNVLNPGDRLRKFAASQTSMWGIENAKINNNIFIGDNSGLTISNRYGTSSIIAEFYNNIVEVMNLFDRGAGGTVTIISHGNNLYKEQPNVSKGFNFTVNESERVLVTDEALETLFVDFDTDGTGSSDFRLAPGSLAIDFGNPNYGPATDILGNPRDAQPDAGCYEYGSTPLKGDLDKDGIINIQDVQACVNHILGKQDWGSAADVNRDGTVDKADVQEIINIILGK